MAEHEQIDEQNPPKEPELAGQLDEKIKINFIESLIKNQTYNLHFEFWHTNPSVQLQTDEQKPPNNLEVVGQLIKMKID